MPKVTAKKKKSTEVQPPVIRTQAQRLAGYLPTPKSAESEKDASNAGSTEKQRQKQQAETAASDKVAKGKKSDSSQAVQGENKKSSAESDKEAEAKKLEQAKKLRDQNEAARQSRIRMGKRLEALRPTMSANKKQKAAENTGVLYHVDASYEPSPSTLPSVITPQHEMLLLTVNLSSNGEVLQHRSKTNQGVDSGFGLSATYTTILTWLLSRVPDKFNFLNGILEVEWVNNGMPDAPFFVVGLQQLFLDGQLALYIAITPIQPSHLIPEVKQTNKKSKQVRDELKDSTVFQQSVQRYLTRNKLQTVCPWLDHLVSNEVQSRVKSSDAQSGGEGEGGAYIYRPDLPNITQKPLSTFVQVNPDPNGVAKVFGLECGFFWETIETDEQVVDHNLKDDGVNYDTQNTMSLIYKQIYRCPSAIMGMFNRILQEGFDLAGIRLLYPNLEAMKGKAANSSLPSVISQYCDNQSPVELLNNVGPVLALAIRGTFARQVWLECIGPADPVLARRTDPKSLCALFGGESRDNCLLYCPRSPSRVETELVYWFGGRVPASGVIDVGHASPRKNQQNTASKAGKKSKKGSGANTAGSGNASSQASTSASSLNMSSSVLSLLEIPNYKPPATLTATTKGEVLLVVSPQVPVKCIGLILATAQRKGYQLRGIRRLRLTAKQALVLGISSKKLKVFSVSNPHSRKGTQSLFQSQPLFIDIEYDSASSSVDVKDDIVNYCPSTVFLLCKENALHSMASLIEAFMVQMSLLNILGSLRKSASDEVCPSDFFHMAAYSDSILSALGGDFSKCPEAELSTIPGYICPQLHTNPEMEQIVVVTLTSHVFMKNCGLFIGKLQAVVPYHQISTLKTFPGGFELLGIKWLPCLSMQHARELTPFEVGDLNWKSSVKALTSEPAVVLVLRGINAFERMTTNLAASFPTKLPKNSATKTLSLDRIMSTTPELAFRQTSLFFKAKELFADNAMRNLVQHYLPPLRSPKIDTEIVMRGKKNKVKTVDISPMFAEENILHTMQAGPQHITTVLVVKPDAVHKHFIKLLRRVAQEGFKVVGLRLEQLTRELAEHIVPEDDRRDPILMRQHVDYVVSGSCLLLCLMRENAVKKLLDCIGPDDPKSARIEPNFYWSAVFGINPVANGLHASASYAMSVTEQKLFFPHGLCCPETADLAAENIQCPGEDPIIDTNFSKSNRKVDMVTFKSHDEDSDSSAIVSSEESKVLPVVDLCQINCVLFMPTLMRSEGRSKRFPYIEILDRLVSQGFEIVGARMVWLTTEQAQSYLHIINAGTFHLVPCLTSGPCLVLAVRRDNAVLAFDTYLGSSFDKDSILSKHNYELFRAKDLKQASNLVKFFFDKLLSPT